MPEQVTPHSDPRGNKSTTLFSFLKLTIHTDPINQRLSAAKLVSGNLIPWVPDRLSLAAVRHSYTSGNAKVRYEVSYGHV